MATNGDGAPVRMQESFPLDQQPPSGGTIPQKMHLTSEPTQDTGRFASRAPEVLSSLATAPLFPPPITPTGTAPALPYNGMPSLPLPALPDADEPGKKQKKTRRTPANKAGKGLRYYSMKVCEKVEKKGTTTYNEVADELVAEITSSLNPAFDQQYDQNIRRRVYDAFNVLMAMDIIAKEKREIRWVGLPTSSKQDALHKELERRERAARVESKRKQLEEVEAQERALRRLVARNSRATNVDPADKIMLPFIIVNSKPDTVIECEMAEDRTEYFFNFSGPFEIHDENEILKRMRLGEEWDVGQPAPPTEGLDGL